MFSRNFLSRSYSGTHLSYYALFAGTECVLTLRVHKQSTEITRQHSLVGGKLFILQIIFIVTHKPTYISAIYKKNLFCYLGRHPFSQIS